MRRIYLGVAVALCLVPFGAGEAIAAEKEMPLKRSGWGPSHAVRAAGCDVSWTSEAMRLSGVKPEDVRRLPLGKVIVMPADCEKPAPPAIAARTREILRGGTPELVAPEAVAATSPAPDTVPASTLQAAERRVQSLADALQKEQQAHRATRNSLGASRTRRTLVAVLLGAGIVLLLGAALYLGWFRRRFAVYRREIEEELQGNVKKFTLAPAGWVCECGTVTKDRADREAHMASSHQFFEQYRVPASG